MHSIKTLQMATYMKSSLESLKEEKLFNVLHITISFVVKLLNFSRFMFQLESDKVLSVYSVFTTNKVRITNL